jgi:hypothetical protein
MKNKGKFSTDVVESSKLLKPIKPARVEITKQ